MTVYYMNILHDTKSSVNIIGFLHGTVASVVALGPRGHRFDFRGAPNAKKSLISTFGTILSGGTSGIPKICLNS